MKTLSIAAGLVFLLLGPIPAMSQQPASKSAAVIQRSGFIFQGTVQKVAASNLKALPAASNTVIVRVDEILKSPQVLQAFRGRDVTVQLKEGEALKEGQRAVFYTSGWLYGESIAVKSEGLTVGTADGTKLKEDIARVDSQKAENALRARLSRSVLVVTGKVIETQPLVAADKRVPKSEHDPDWWRAQIEVASVDKGQRPPGNRVTVFFANSTDEQWIKSPKLKPGDEGVFQLHSDFVEEIGQPGYTVWNPVDFQPLSQRTLIQRLITPRR